ncbi:MAG: hypothetical protein JO040_00135, partial [Gemmatimonadetes bacterium]|nr:hypothetical protein [Gemmatimonadota bacterium]
MRRHTRWLAPALALVAAGCGDRSASRQGAGDSSEAYAAVPAAQAPAAAPAPAAAQGVKPACEPGNGGITLPQGFCAVVVADKVGRPRHVAVAPNGDVYVALDEGRSSPGGILALRDTNGDG